MPAQTATNKMIAAYQEIQNLLTKCIITVTIGAICLKECEQWLWYCPSLHLLSKIKIFLMYPSHGANTWHPDPLTANLQRQALPLL